MEEQYKLKILKDILKDSKASISKEEIGEFMHSPIYQKKNYFTSAALLVKEDAITIEELFSLRFLRVEELSLYLEPVEDTFDYFKLPNSNEVFQALKYMEDYSIKHSFEALKNKERNEARYRRIKEFNELMHIDEKGRLK